MLFTRRQSPTRSSKKQDAQTLHQIERLLVAEHESAMSEFLQFPANLSGSKEATAACKKAVVAMRRLGAFLKTGEIPADLLPRNQA